MRTIGLAIAALLAMTAYGQAADPNAGRNIFRRCQACHKVGEAALRQRAVGPHLNGLFGRKAGSVEGFNYSKANRDSGITWTEDVFTAYIKNPRSYMKGTRMAFAGIRDERDIADLIAYLKQFKADGTTAE